MKHYITLVVLCLFLSKPSFAQKEWNVVTRDSRGAAQITTEEIQMNEDRFENSDFKIVVGKSNEAISVNDPRISDETKLKAANTLFHLEHAKKYFTHTVKSLEVAKLEPITIRLEHINQFSDLGHFMNDAKEPQFNNALSIPAGVGMSGANIAPWKREIWFRPEKHIPVAEIMAMQGGNPLNPVIKKVRSAIYPMEMGTGLSNVVYALVNPQGSWSNTLLSSETLQAGTLLLFEAGFQIMRFLNKVLTPSHYFLDTAMIPEIITHEFSHIALSDYLELSHSTPVIEGLADYFSASLNETPKLALKIKQYSTAQGKNGKNKKLFAIEYENNRMANSDFVLSLLWGMREVLGKENADQVIFESRKYLKTNSSDIRTGLINALVIACNTTCKQPANDRLKLFIYFEKRGL